MAGSAFENTSGPKKLLTLLRTGVWFHFGFAQKLLKDTVGAVYDRAFFLESTKYARS